MRKTKKNQPMSVNQFITHVTKRKRRRGYSPVLGEDYLTDEDMAELDREYKRDNGDLG